MNGGRIKYLWVLVGGYLIYLGVGQYQFVYRGEADMPAVSIAFGTLFIAVGGLVLLREWRAYRYAQEHPEEAEDGAEPDMDADEYGDTESDGEPDALPEKKEDEDA